MKDADAQKLWGLAIWLAQRYPNARFRSGNAPGSDETFANAIREINPARIEYFLPVPGHRKNARDTRSRTFSPNSLTPERVAELAELAARATRADASLIQSRDRSPRLRSLANYLLRDTLKVTGDPAQGFAPATLAFFNVKPGPETGGTWHTIRVCQLVHVPVILNNDWMKWNLQPPNPSGGAELFNVASTYSQAAEKDAISIDDGV